jgi:hypothetical protein
MASDIELAKLVEQFMGNVVYSLDVQHMMNTSGKFRASLTIYLYQFQMRDYGDLHNYPEDEQYQNEVLQDIAEGGEGTLYGFYDYEGQRINIIQETYEGLRAHTTTGSNTVVTVCLPHER